MLRIAWLRAVMCVLRAVMLQVVAPRVAVRELFVMLQVMVLRVSVLRCDMLATLWNMTRSCCESSCCVLFCYGWSGCMSTLSAVSRMSASRLLQLVVLRIVALRVALRIALLCTTVL